MFDALSVGLPLLEQALKVSSKSSQLPDSLVFRPRSTRCLGLCHRRRCAPNRVKSLPKPAKRQNSDASTILLNPMPIVPLQRDCARTGRETLQNELPLLASSPHSTASPVRPL